MSAEQQSGPLQRRAGALTLLGVATLALVGLITWRYQEVSTENESAAARRATERAHAIANGLHDTVAATLLQADTKHDLARLLTEARLAGAVETELSLRRFVDNERASSPDVALIGSTSGTGKRLWSSLNYDPPPADLSGTEHLKALIADPALPSYFSAPVTGGQSRERVVQYAQPVRDGPGHLQAITIVSLRVTMLARLAKDIDLTPDDTVTLVRDDGVVLMHTGNTHLGQKVSFAETVLQGATLAALPDPVDGRTRFIAGRRLAGWPLRLYVGLSRDAQMAGLAETNQTLWRSSLLIDAAILVLAITGGWTIRVRARAATATARAESLAESEGLLRSVLNSMHDGVLVRDRAPDGNFTIVWANSAATTLIGIPAEKLIGSDVSSVVVADDEALFAARKEQASRGGASDPVVYRMRRPDGSSARVSAYTVPLPIARDASRRSYITVLRDVTIEHEREAALAESRAQTERILQVMPGVFYHLTRESLDDPTPLVRFVSASVGTLFGVSPEIAVRPNFLLSHVEGDLVAMRKAALMRAGPDGIGVAEYAVQLDDGRRFWLRDTIRRLLRPNGGDEFFGVISNATTEHAADQARRAGEVALQHMNWALAAYARSLAALIRADTLAEIAARVCESIVQQPPYNLACVAIPERGPGSPIRILASAGPARGYLDGINLTWSDDARGGRGPTGTALRDGNPQILRDALTEDWYAPWRERGQQWGIRSSTTVPCTIDGHVVCALLVYASEPNAFGAAELELFQRLSDEIGFAITLDRDRARMRQTEENLRASVQLGPGLLYRARVYAGGADVLAVFGDATRLTAGLLNAGGTPATLSSLLAIPARVAAILAVNDGAEATDDQPVSCVDGGTRWIRNAVRVTIRLEDSADIVGYLSDVTRETREQLQRQQLTTVITLGEMATGIAHELNTPLTSISFAAQNARTALSRDPPNLATANDKLDRVVSQTERAARLIDHMRVFARNEHQPVAPVSWADVLDSALDILTAKLRGCEVIRDIQADLPAVLGAPIPMEQVLINLIGNAADAYAAAPPSTPRRIAIDATAEAGTVILRVTDHAGGIPPHVLPRIFEPFFTTKPVGKGTGLGLSLAFGTITDMGGTITAANTDGGAIFEIRMPAHRPPG